MPGLDEVPGILIFYSLFSLLHPTLFHFTLYGNRHESRGTISIALGRRSGDFIHVHRQQIIDKSSAHQTFYDVEYSKEERKHPHGGRYIPRTSEINEVIELAKQLAGDSDYVFHDKAGEQILNTSYELHLRRACDRLGIEASNNPCFPYCL